MKRIVFLCVENSNRSQMAEAFARMIEGDTIEAYSAGSKPSGKVNLNAVQAMARLGYDLTVHDSKSLTDLPDVPFDVAVTMGCGDECPMIKARRREEWSIPDPKEMTRDEFEAVRDLIGEKVCRLIAELKDST